MMILPTIHENVTVQHLSEWDENYLLLQKYQYYHGPISVNDETTFWMVTQSPKLNRFLAYSRVEISLKRNQENALWLDRKKRLADIGIQFEHTNTTNQMQQEQQEQTTVEETQKGKKLGNKKRKRNSSSSSDNKPLNKKKDQEWMVWIRHETEEDYFDYYIPKMRKYRVKSLKKVPQVWLPETTTAAATTATRNTYLEATKKQSGIFTTSTSTSPKQQQQQKQDLVSRFFALASRQTEELARMVAIAA